MASITRLSMLALAMMFAIPATAQADMQALQIFECDFEDEGTADKLLSTSAAWLEVARKTKGGENLNLAIRFPIAEGTSDSDFKFVITVPTFTEWGMFTDAYEDSAVKEADGMFEGIASCASSTMWEGIRIK